MSSLTEEQGREVVALARKTLERFVAGQDLEIPGEWSELYLKQERGVFVTLKNSDGSLRGCIGFPYPVGPLGAAVIEATVAAASRDPRFPRVTGHEMAGILVEASVLTLPQKLTAESVRDLPKQVRIGVDGVIDSNFFKPRIGDYTDADCSTNVGWVAWTDVRSGSQGAEIWVAKIPLF